MKRLHPVEQNRDTGYRKSSEKRNHAVLSAFTRTMTRETRARGLYSPLDLDEREKQKLATLREMLSFFIKNRIVLSTGERNLRA